jgi:hypothetical protein
MSFVQWKGPNTNAMEALAVVVIVAGIVYGAAKFGLALVMS